MKILKFLVPIMIATLLFTGCDTEPPAPEPVGTIADFFPFHENTLIAFDDPVGPWGSVSYTVYTDGNRMQRLTMAGELSVTEVFEIADGELRVNYANDRASGFERMIDKVSDVPMIILQEPLILGNSWTIYVPTFQGVARGYSTITSVDVEVTTPYGVVTAIEVSTEFEHGATTVDFFANGIGRVQSGFFVPGFEEERGDTRIVQEELQVMLTLRAIEENTHFNVDYFVVFPNDNVDDLDFAFGVFEFRTNDDIRPAFERLLRNPGDREYGLISDNTTINFIDVSWVPDPESPQFDMAIVHLDLSEDFVNDMNVGAAYELLLLESIEITMRDFFSARAFILTVDGQPYVLRH